MFIRVFYDETTTNYPNELQKSTFYSFDLLAWECWLQDVMHLHVPLDSMVCNPRKRGYSVLFYVNMG